MCIRDRLESSVNYFEGFWEYNKNKGNLTLEVDWVGEFGKSRNGRGEYLVYKLIEITKQKMTLRMENKSGYSMTYFTRENG